jgi:hypothetical protein
VKKHIDGKNWKGKKQREEARRREEAEVARLREEMEEARRKR